MITEGAMPEDFYGDVPDRCPRCQRAEVYPVWVPQLKTYLCHNCNDRRAGVILRPY